MVGVSSSGPAPGVRQSPLDSHAKAQGISRILGGNSKAGDHLDMASAAASPRHTGFSYLEMVLRIACWSNYVICEGRSSTQNSPSLMLPFMPILSPDPVKQNRFESRWLCLISNPR